MPDPHRSHFMTVMRWISGDFIGIGGGALEYCWLATSMTSYSGSALPCGGGGGAGPTRSLVSVTQDGIDLVVLNLDDARLLAMVGGVGDLSGTLPLIL